MGPVATVVVQVHATLRGPGSGIPALGGADTTGRTAPILGQTPFQYRDQLQYAFPTKARDLEVLVGAYVRTLYGRKELTDAQRGALATAWVQLRGQLLLRIFRRG